MRSESSIAGWLLALILGVRALLLLSPIVAAFILVTSFAAALIEQESWRWAAGGVATIVVPGIVFWRVAGFLKRRTRFVPPSGGWFIAVANLMVATTLAFGFADDAGRALRRHGDWFVGERNGAVARFYRAGVGNIAAYFEKFDPPAELAPVIIPPDPRRIPEGPWLPGGEPPESLPTTLAWFHPLPGPRRAMPITESRRFGAPRPQPRPAECELGHCGVDLGSTVGEPVFSVFDGVVEKIERDESQGGRAGRYLRIGHKDGTVVSRYIHLDSIREDLREGDHVSGGQLIARLGQSGILHSAPHLHFGLSLRTGGRGSGSERYVDPEPYLRTWQLADANPLTAGASLTATASIDKH